jgi:thiamine pyrophosphate-dependent acetolactate synthase large subunit-like protein
MAMPLRDALEPIAENRGDRVVISTMSAVGVWPELSDTPLDFAYIPSSMGQGPSLGLGLALATKRGVVVLCGDGSLLMNLGCLVTIATNPAPLWLVLLENGLYEVTGGQPIAGAGQTDFEGLARSAGIGRAHSFVDRQQWQSSAPLVFSGDGPVFVRLAVEGRLGQLTPSPPRPMAEQLARLRNALGS